MTLSQALDHESCYILVYVHVVKRATHTSLHASSHVTEPILQKSSNSIGSSDNIAVAAVTVYFK
jgi:hypothetical protein